MTYDPRYYATYYAIDAINFEPVKSPAVMDTVDAAYLPLVIQEAAGVPLDPSFDEQKKIMLRCKGLFYACKDGAEARRFNRLLIDAGIIKGLIAGFATSSSRGAQRRSASKCLVHGFWHASLRSQ